MGLGVRSTAEMSNPRRFSGYMRLQKSTTRASGGMASERSISSLSRVSAGSGGAGTAF